ILGLYIFSRYSLSFSLDRLFPTWMSSVTRRTHQPWAGIVVVSVIGAVLLPLITFYYQAAYEPLIFLLFFLPMVTVSLTCLSLVRPSRNVRATPAATGIQECEERVPRPSVGRRDLLPKRGPRGAVRDPPRLASRPPVQHVRRCLSVPCAGHRRCGRCRSGPGLYGGYVRENRVRAETNVRSGHRPVHRRRGPLRDAARPAGAQGGREGSREPVALRRALRHVG